MKTPPPGVPAAAARVVGPAAPALRRRSGRLQHRFGAGVGDVVAIGTGRAHPAGLLHEIAAAIIARLLAGAVLVRVKLGFGDAERHETLSNSHLTLPRRHPVPPPAVHPPPPPENAPH